jgi:serine/threonine-protein kinase
MSATDALSRLNAALEGRYRIERELGEGGMATVYLAEDLRHHRNVALKVLKPELAAVVGAERFLTEIETTAQLQHPNILPLFDSGEADGFLFYVMPHVEGESLRDRIEREKQLPVDEAVRVAVEVAEALQAAHEHGVVHRDIKPANIMMSRGRPLVADFGIALALSSAGGHRLTETGLSVGTPHYMSPEQATGDRIVGPASDVYSLGCVLYEMLVGEPPYTGSTAQAVLGRVITSDPESVTSQRRAVPLHVDAVVARALEKLPADRFASAADFARALGEESFRHRPVALAGAAASTRVRAAAMVGWVAAAVLGGLWLAGGAAPESPRPVRHLSLTFQDGTGPSEWLALAPDGSALVLADRPRDDAARFALYVQRLDDLSRTPIPESRDGFDPSFSPDGTMVAFGGWEGLRVAPLAGGSTRTLVSQADVCCVRWASDGYIYYQSENDIYRVRDSGGTEEFVLGHGGSGAFAYYEPAGDGRRAVFSSFQGGASDDRGATIEWVDGASGERHLITPGIRPFLTEEGYLVFGRDESIHAARLDLRSMELVEGPVRMVERVGVVPPNEAMFALSRSGDLLYWVPQGVAELANELLWVGRDGAVTPVDPEWTENFESVELSPDGSRAAVTVGVVDRTEIWIKELDDGPVRRATSYQGMNRRPVWSPDGRSLAFISDRGGFRAAYRVPTDGIVAPEVLVEHPGEDVDEVFWAPDGDWVIYRTGTTPTARDIYARRIRPDTATIAVAARPGIDERAPALSPNGRWLAYVSGETGRDEIWVRPFPDVGAGSRRVSPGGSAVEPVWSDDGDELFFRTAEGLMALEITDVATFATGEVRRLFEAEGILLFTSHRRYTYDGRGDRFLMMRELSQEAVPSELILVQNFIEEVKVRLGG